MTDSDDDLEPKRFNIPETLHFMAFGCVFLNLLLSPWCFGSWEMWWFWPMATLIFAGCFFSGIASLFGSTLSSSSDGEPQDKHFTMNGKILAALLSVLPFFLYAVIRAQFPSAPGRPLVDMDAERSLMLFFTPAAIAAILFLSFTRRRLRVLFTAFLVNALVLAVYAVISQYLTYGEEKPDYVMWVLTPWGYGDRVKGSFFCPNHLSAYLNFALCLCVAILFTPRTRRRTRLLVGATAILLTLADFLTLSRGGLASIMIGLFIGIPTVAMRGYKLTARLIAPLAAVSVLAIALLAIIKTENPLMTRVKMHPLYRTYTTAVTDVGSAEWRQKMSDSFWYSFDRGTYIQSGLRAWRSNPVWGIGPGQHSSRWAEFAATDDGIKPVDGDLSTMKRPRLTNSGYHLYEVHSDWTQLLEEYGTVGLTLFLIPMLIWIGVTYASQSASVDYANTQKGTSSALPLPDSAENDTSLEARRRSNHRRHHNHSETLENEDISELELALPLASLLTCLVMTIHSLGDFSFQIPSLTWMFGAILAAGILVTSKPYHRD